MKKLTIGFPRMHKEAGEIRDFLPSLMHRLASSAKEIIIETGIGSGLGISFSEHIQGYGNIHFGSNPDCYDQDVVVQIRAPEDNELGRMKPGTILFSMLHYPTHPHRIKRIQELGLLPLSIDSIVGEDGCRLIEYLRGTSWIAMQKGFKALHKTYPRLSDSGRKPVEVVIAGAGATGRFAAESAVKYGDINLHRKLMERGVPGVIVHIIGRNITYDKPLLARLLIRADMLVDATARKANECSRHIFPNDMIGNLPDHAVIVDIAADPYDTDVRPMSVKGIEGIPTGNMEQFEFPPTHPAFDQLPHGVCTTNRRMTLSCYSWPCLRPADCMQRYGRQVGDMLEVLMQIPYNKLSINNGRSLYTGTLAYYLEKRNNGPP
jgi:alanine dehydrogenase